MKASKATRHNLYAMYNVLYVCLSVCVYLCLLDFALLRRRWKQDLITCRTYQVLIQLISVDVIDVSRVTHRRRHRPQLINMSQQAEPSPANRLTTNSCSQIAIRHHNKCKCLPRSTLSIILWKFIHDFTSNFEKRNREKAQRRWRSSECINCHHSLCVILYFWGKFVYARRRHTFSMTAISMTWYIGRH